MKSPRLLLAWTAIALLTAATAWAQDRIVFADGGRMEGRISALYREGVRLDSGEGLTDHDWSVVSNLTTSKEVTVALANKDRITGRIVGIQGSVIRIHTASLGEIRIPTQALAARPAPPPAKPGPLTPKDWNGRVALGVSFSTGDSSTFTGTVEALLQKDWSHDHLEFHLFAIYGTADGNVNNNAQEFRSRWEHHYDESLYTYLQASAGRDEIQELELRFLLDVGAGYTVWKDSDKELFAVEGGLGYRHESFTASEDARNDITARGALVYRDVFFGALELTEEFEVLIPLTEPSTFIANSRTATSLPIDDNWSLRSTLIVGYQNDPAGSADNFRIIGTAGIEYKF